MWCWLLENKEIIAMFINLVLAVAGLLILRTLSLQRAATQAAMFSDIAGRISSILGETPQPEVDVSFQHNWIVRLLNELEVLVFLANGKLISKKMKMYYEEFTIGWIDDLPKKYPEATKLFMKNQPAAYQELRKFYRSRQAKDAYIFSRE